MPSDPILTATYRLQLQPGFGFREAAAGCGYLADLGVSHLYLSPVLQAAPGSKHGYDVVDHTRLSAELGGEEGWQELVASTRSHGLGIVVDVVPNHMAAPEPEWLNAPLWDVLAHGRSAAHADWFDVDWDFGDGKLVLPILGSAGDVPRIDDSGPDGAPVLRYYEHAFPLAPGTEGLVGEALLEAQHYRLVPWRESAQRLNYRRFFDITSLMAVRVEDAAVFDATHALLLAKVAAGEIQGLRIDHPDGLADPFGYLARLAERAPGAWVVVEKILEPGERLPQGWPVAGTTGYDALAAVTAAFNDPGAQPAMTQLYRELAGGAEGFADVALAGKRQAALDALRPENRRLLRVAGTPDALQPLAELLAAWPTYRSYVPVGGPPSPADARAVLRAGHRAALACPGAWGALELFQAAVLTGAGELATRFQQTSGMVMAKGVEDTAFYRYHRLAALCEVGGDPARFGSPDDFHRAAAHLQQRWPATMTALSTHDTKRSEDVRARLLALTEYPEEWGAAVRRWVGGARPPDPQIGYLFWQTLVGAWPLAEDRAARYLEKAAREAKAHTSWTDPDPGYEEALRRFVGAVYADRGLLDDLARFVTALSPAAAANALGTKLVQLTMPGVPDVYQDSEGVYLRLVDPDNRGPAQLSASGAGGGLDAAKRRLTRTALHLRREHPDWFGPAAGYTPLAAAGPAARHALAFGRGPAVTLATRRAGELARAGGWRDTVLPLPDGRFTDLIGGGRHAGAVPLADVLAGYPVALLVPARG